MRQNGIRAYQISITLIFLIVLFTIPATVSDAMFRANPQHTGIFDNGGTGVSNTESWRFKTGSEVLSSPAVSNGVVYFGSRDNNLYAIDAATGKEKWRFLTGDEVDSSPAVSNGVVYFGSRDNNLYAIDAATGKEKWRFLTGDEVDSSPAVSNGVVYIYSTDGNFYAIDSTTGFEKSHFLTGSFNLFTVSSSPTVENAIVYFGETSNFHAIDATTGTEKWRFVTGDIRGLNYGITSPAVANGIVYVGTWEKNLYAIDAVTGKEKWRFVAGGNIYSSSAVICFHLSVLNAFHPSTKISINKIPTIRL